MPKDEWAQEKKDLKSKDARTFLYTANHLLLQRIPALTELVRASEKRLLTLALDGKAKPEHRLDAIKALGTLESDPAKLAPLLATDKSSKILQAVAIAIAGPEGTVASEPATTKLIAKLAKPGDWSPQYDALVALRYFSGDDRIAPAIVAALGHAQAAVVREAIVALGHQRNLHEVPRLIAFLGSKNPQHVAAAARALWRIHLPPALAPLADKKHYAHALSLAKDPINGRFGVHALPWFSAPTVNDDLEALAASEDGEVAEGACAGLLQRKATGSLAPLARRLFARSDASYYGRFFLVLQNDLAAITARPPAPVIAELAIMLGAVKTTKLEELISGSEQLRYRLDRLDPVAKANVATWREALGKKIKDKQIAALAKQMMTSPSDE